MGHFARNLQFYGAHCDFLVSDDKNLRAKAKALYYYLNISTKVLTSSEFNSQIESVIHVFPDKDSTGLFTDILQHIDLSNLKNYTEQIIENDVISFGKILPIFYFNYFNCVNVDLFQNEGIIIITFRKIFKNYSNFIYYSEAVRIIDYITTLLGYYNDDYEEKKRILVYENKPVEFTWTINNGLIILENEPETGRPILKFLVKHKTE